MNGSEGAVSSTPDLHDRRPALSVIIATYNRSYTLRHAIQSVRDSSFTDWELIVVGDACTDDSAECVASFADARMSFVNLPRRCGDQSGPNNRGVELARGRYLAFLNHDDLYLPDHLSRCIAALDAGGADLVWVPCAMVTPRARPTTDGLPCDFSLTGVPVGSGYTPYQFYFASSWVLRRGLAEKVGPWAPPRRHFVTPSQAWLFRAWRLGATLQFLPHVTTIAVPADYRPGCYALRESPDHEWLARWRREEPRWRELMFEAAALNESLQGQLFGRFRKLRAIRRLVAAPIQALLLLFGIHPFSLNAMSQGLPGSAVRKHRRRAGAQ